MDDAKLLIRDAISSFSAGQELRTALFLTYTFDGKWLEDGFIPDLFERHIAHTVVIRDGHNVISQAPNVRYHRANALYTRRVFHPKLCLLTGQDQALAIIGSANLSRGGLERNLELGSAVSISVVEGGPSPFFEELYHYLTGMLQQEVQGQALESLKATAIALREVLDRIPRAARTESPFRFFHNYSNCIWDQLLSALPHKHIRQISIISPFFEPDILEDPIFGDGDEGIFSRLFDDLIFEAPENRKPVSIFFQQSETGTQLPFEKLKKWQSLINLYQRSSTSDEPRPLHGKLLIIEGAAGPRRKPYLYVLHGSPNFTKAAFLTKPPEGNAEIAVLTALPDKKNGTESIWNSLRLPILFSEVIDWTTLTYRKGAENKSSIIEDTAISTVDLSLADATLTVSNYAISIPGAMLRILADIEGNWIEVAHVPCGTDSEIRAKCSTLFENNGQGIVSLRSAHVKLQFETKDGIIIKTCSAPVNVDQPQDFCGLTLTGPLLTSIDQRIAQAGCGIRPSYRDQQKLLEQLISRTNSKTKTINVHTHQADLDRFFRNLNSGLTGTRTRYLENRNSEFSLRQAVKDVIFWFKEAITDSDSTLSLECKLYLVDRLLRELEILIGPQNDSLGPLLTTLNKEYTIRGVLCETSGWLEKRITPETKPFLKGTAKRLRELIRMLPETRAVYATEK